MTTIFIECKKTDKIDFIKPLRRFIVSEFGKDQAEQYDRALDKLNTAREDIRLNTERTESVRSKLISYIGLINNTEKHFPIGDNGIRINFYWYDNVSKKRASQYGLDYERACVQFNIGAIESQIAFLHNRATDDGVKNACKYFQMAAGTFASLLEITQNQPHLCGTPDLSPEYLNLLINIMLAQAQECFFEKAERGGMKPKILYKLAAQVYDYYDKANTFVSIPALKSSIQNFWPTFILYRSSMYKGIAHYFRGLAAFAEDKYGEQVGWYALANNFIQDPTLVKKLKSQPVALQQQFIEKQSTIGAALKSAHYDNSKIYHELVPKSLPPLEKTTMVKPLPFSIDSETDDPFRGLISRAIAQSSDSYKVQVNQQVQQISASVEESDSMAKTILASLNLPSSIQALETPKGIPSALRSRVSQFKKIGGLERLETTFSTANTYSDDAKQLLDQCKRILNEEEELNKEMRNKHGNRWSLPDSHLVNSNYTAEISKYENNLTHAQKSDALVRGRYNNIKPILSKLGSDNDLNSLLPAGEPPSKETTECVKNLKISLSKLEDIITERETLLKEVLKTTEKDDISGLLMTGNSDPQTVMENELLKYNDYKTEINNNITKQQNLFKEITDLNSKFIESNNSNGSSTREDAIKRINESLDTCQELFKNLGEGINFYQQFCEILNTLKSNCERFSNDRKAAKNSLELRLNQPQQSSSGFTSNIQQPNPYPNIPQQYRQSVPSQYQPQSNTSGQYSQQTPQPYVQIQGPDGKVKFIPASNMPYYQSNR